MTRFFSNTHYDAVVVGARCAGAATALLLARSGARVLMVDREERLHDTLSTHALMRPAVSLLSRWGLLDRIVRDDTPLVRQIRFHYGDETFDVPVKPSEDVPGLCAPRRWVLDRVLRDAAWDAGVELHTGTALVGLQRDGSGRVCGADLMRKSGEVETVTAGIVIGADGRQSRLAELVQAHKTISSEKRSACIYTYVDGVPNEGYRWYFGDRVAAGLLPTTQGAHCFFAACDPRALGGLCNFDAFGGGMQMLAQWDDKLAAEIGQRGPIERVRRFAGAPGFMRQCTGPGWALVGDAGYFKDPLTAHGISDAFLDAQRLSDALGKTPGDAGAYQAARNRLAPRMFVATQNIAGWDWSLDELKLLHGEVNACVKEEQAELSRGATYATLAA